MSRETRPIVIEAPVIHHRTDPVQGDEAPSDPRALASDWLPRDGEDRMLMTLATIDVDGFPRARTVMLTEFDGERFYFHTDAESRKVADLARNPRVSITLVWPAFSRQLVVQGTAARADDDEIASAYRGRSPYLRQLAWQNTADFAAMSLTDRETAWARFRDEEPDPGAPAGWVGFGVLPHRYLFWVSHPDAASRRLEFTRAEERWTSRHLPG